MRLVVVGSGTGIPSPRRGPAGYLVEAAGHWMLWDCGPGTLERLVRGGHDWKLIDHVFLTHLHPDHCADLVAVLFANNWHLERRREVPLRVIGPPGTDLFVRRLYEAFDGLGWAGFAPAVREWGDDPVWTEPAWSVRAHPVDHAGLQATALRLECEGRVFVFSGDTTETPPIVEAARGADTLLIECAMPDEMGPQKVHLTAGGAGRVAAAAGVRRVVLTHFYPPCETVDVGAQCAAAFGGEVVVAHDGLVLDI